MERPAKRQRLSGASDVPVPTQQEVRQASKETGLEVDILILDYLAQKTIQICLESRGDVTTLRRSKTLLEDNILMCDDFFALFQKHLGTYTPDKELRFRILLLQFTTLFTQRLTSNCTTPSTTSLKSYREENVRRARTWWEATSALPSESFNRKPYESSTPSCTPDILERNRAHVLNVLGVPQEDGPPPFYGTELCPSLLDVLPIFMQLSALVTSILDQCVKEQWMELASEFMLQASLEQYLIYGAQGPETIDVAFSWGPLPPTPVTGTPQAGQKPLASNPLHPDEDINLILAAQATQWAEIKGKCLTALFPTPASSDALKTPTSAQATETLASMLEEAVRDFPIQDFDTSVLNFISAVSRVIPEPVLMQLERGSLDGMTEQETQTFLTDVCGLNDDEQNLGWKEFTGLPTLPNE